MPNTNVVSYGKALDGASAYYPNQRLTQNYTVSKWNRVSRTWNDRQHRVRPVDLRFSPTSLAVQTTQVDTVYHDKWFQVPLSNKGWASCGDHNGAGSWGYLGYDPVPSIPTGTWANSLRNRIKDTQGFNIMEDCAEARETVSLMTSIGQRVARGVQTLLALKRGDIKTARMLYGRPFDRRDIASAHLASSWGVAPLMETLSGVMYDMNKELMQDALYTKRYTAKSGWSHDSSRSSGEYRYRTRVEYSERAVFWVKFYPDGVRAVQFGNILELGWNLLTLSHMVDWFIPVGQALSALDAGSGVREVKGTVTCKEWTDQQVWLAPTKRDGYAYSLSVLQKQEKSVRKHWRTAHSSLPAATLPRWQPNASVGKLLLAVSVLVGLKGAPQRRPSDPYGKVTKAEKHRLARQMAREKSQMLQGRRKRPVRDPWGVNPL